GRGGDDFMVDGDSDTGNGDAAPGPDLIIGGEDSCDLPYNLNNSCGGDMVSYSGRNGSVSVDLADRRPDGQPGERDSVGDVESIEGGSGADRLFGDEHSNTLVGGPGRDRLTGRGGRDEFSPGGIEETGRGRPGPWKPPARATADTVSCGGGSFDNVWSPRRITLVGRGCEQVSWSGGDDFRPYPKPIRGGFLEYKVPACPYAETDGMRVPRCRGRVRLAEASGRHRTLAAMAIPFRRAVGGTEYAVPRLEIPLTALGRRLAATRRKVRATLQIDYESRGGSVRFAWRIELKLPR
ncbi:MAG TPA: calcium-binding protein, partial [Candidatus Krumholzibacteria bacterium]|nr:calcium-binding protein [Candidatus Krumholzibacteria bacterium]